MAVVGVKGWWADGTRRAVRIQGRNRTQVGNDLALWPLTDFQIAMIYFDTFSVDGLTRHRRVMMGNDFYGVYYDQSAPAALRDWAFAQTDILADTLTWPVSAVKFTGSLMADALYEPIRIAAMADMKVSEFGLVPVPNTDDR